MKLIEIEEDCQFFLAQRKSGRQGRMGSIDMQLHKKEKRKIERTLKQQSFAEKTKLQNEDSEESSQVTTIPESSNDSSVSSEASDDYIPQKWHMKKNNPSETELPPPKRSKEVVTPGLAAALDRTKTSDRNATYVISQAL